MTIKPPPRYLPYPAAVKYAKHVPAELRDFFASLYGLAWSTKYNSTPKITVAELLDFLGMSERTYNDYVQALAGLAWLRSERVETGCVRFHFPQRFLIPSSRVTIQSAAKGIPGAEFCAGPPEFAETSAEFCGVPQNSAETGEEEEEEDSINLLDSSSSSSSNQCVRLLHACGVRAKHLAAIVVDPTITLETILAECARTFSNPQARDKGFCIGANLVKHDLPEARWFFDRIGAIPPEVLTRAGLKHLIPLPLEEEPHYEPEADQTAETETEISGDASLDSLVGKVTPRIAWDRTLAQLEFDMNRASFTTWVSGARAIRYEPQGVLVVGVETEFKRDWLQGRLSSTASRILTGIMDRSITIEFEVIE